MPPRYAYWTILAGGLPTAFRAAERDELLPTFNRLREKHPDAEMKYFSNGTLWASQEEAREASLRRREGGSRASGEHRGRDWRPGGTHRDPRQPFLDEKKARNQDRRKERFARKHGDGQAESADRPTRPDGPAGPNAPRADRDAPQGDWRKRPFTPRAEGSGERPAFDRKPPFKRDWKDKPPRQEWTDRPAREPRGDGPAARADRPTRPDGPARPSAPRGGGDRDAPQGDWRKRPFTPRAEGSGERPAFDRKPPFKRDWKDKPPRSGGSDARDWKNRPPRQEWTDRPPRSDSKARTDWKDRPPREPRGDGSSARADRPTRPDGPARPSAPRGDRDAPQGDWRKRPFTPRAEGSGERPAFDRKPPFKRDWKDKPPRSGGSSSGSGGGQSRDRSGWRDKPKGPRGRK